MSEQITIEVSEDLRRVMGSGGGRELVEAAVLRWFEEGRVSQGQAAAILGIKRGEFFDVLNAHRVSPVQMSVQELEEDFRRG